MADTAAEAFINELLGAGVMLPLRLCDEEVGSVLDDEGQEVLVIDPNRERTDEDSSAVAALVVRAVNAAGGFEERANG